MLFCSSQFITTNQGITATQHWNSPMILLWFCVPFKADATQKTGEKLRTLTHIIPVPHSFRNQSTSSDCKLMALFPYNHNTALKWTQSCDTEPKQVKHTISTEPLHTILRECRRSNLPEDPLHSSRCNRSALVVLSMVIEQKHFYLTIWDGFHCLLCLNHKN